MFKPFASLSNKASCSLGGLGFKCGLVSISAKDDILNLQVSLVSKGTERRELQLFFQNCFNTRGESS